MKEGWKRQKRGKENGKGMGKLEGGRERGETAKKADVSSSGSGNGWLHVPQGGCAACCRARAGSLGSSGTAPAGFERELGRELQDPGQRRGEDRRKGLGWSGRDEQRQQRRQERGGKVTGWQSGTPGGRTGTRESESQRGGQESQKAG